MVVFIFYSQQTKTKAYFEFNSAAINFHVSNLFTFVKCNKLYKEKLGIVSAFSIDRHYILYSI